MPVQTPHWSVIVNFTVLIEHCAFKCFNWALPKILAAPFGVMVLLKEVAYF
ncbi:hypothetical protein ACE6H2_001681 [Prunus campanulata]